MMEQLIKITEKEGKQLVSARDLYDFLDVTTDFTTWCKRMFDYGFVEGTDYAFLKIGEPDTELFNPNPKIDYVLTLDCAKEISMIQRTDKGKLARLYFITMEKIAKQKLLALPNFNNPAEAARAWANEYEKRIIAEKEVKKLEPKAAVTDMIANSANLTTWNETAKILGTGRVRLLKLLRDRSVLMKNNLPYQNFIERGYFVVKVKPIMMGDKSIDYSQTFVTGKGLTWLSNGILNLIN